MSDTLKWKCPKCGTLTDVNPLNKSLTLGRELRCWCRKCFGNTRQTIVAVREQRSGK